MRFALLAMIAACSTSYALRVEVEAPDNAAYKQLVARTEVTVYELDMLSCEQVEFGDVSEDLLRGAAVANQVVHADGRVEGTLDDISRLGDKVIVARLVTDTGVLVAAGCTEQGDIDGEVKVTIKTRVAATVAVDATTLEDPYGWQITIVDPLGDSIAGHEVHWRLFAPVGANPATTSGVIVDPVQPTVWSSATPACTDQRGIARMRLVPPAKVGGFAARFRVSWPARPIELISGFVRGGPGAQLVTDGTATNRCAIRTAGERRVVCTEAISSTPRARRYEVVQQPSKLYSLVDRGAVSIAKPAGVFSVGGEVFALLENGSVANVFGSEPLLATNCTDCTIDDFRVAPACGNDPPRMLMHSTTGAPVRIGSVRGGPIVAFDLPAELTSAGVTATLNTVGCVTTINAQGVENDVQITIVDLESAEGASTRGLFRCGPSRMCSVTLPFANTGVAFMRAGTAAKPEMQMIGTAFDIAGAELVGWVLRPTFDGNTFLLLDRQRIVAAAPPASIAVGKLDGDDEPDLVWNIRATRGTILQASYGHTIEDGSRLSALAPLLNAVDEVVLGDLTGDGIDDVLGLTALGFVVVPQQVDGPAVPDRTPPSACGT